jgi:hypothetical protein
VCCPSQALGSGVWSVLLLSFLLQFGCFQFDVRISDPLPELVDGVLLGLGLGRR